jgi:N-acetylglucosamine malate deacetylase 1
MNSLVIPPGQSVALKISILIITFNKLNYLRGTLLVLQQLNFSRDDFEVIVVDDGSSDGTAEFLSEFEPAYHLVYKRQENAGRSVARNAAAGMARGQILAIVDDDCLLHPDMLSHIWTAHQENPDCMLISNIQSIGISHVPMMLETIAREGSVPWRDLQDYLPVDAEYALVDLMRRIKINGVSNFAVPWIVAQGASITISAKAFKSLVGFDERFVSYGMEDFDFGFRFHELGGRFQYVANALVYHMDHGHQRNVLFKESTVTTRAFYAKFNNRIEIKQFIKFLCGAITFKEFNNTVAQAQGLPLIDGFNLRFSPYGMIRYRDQQLGNSLSTPALSYSKAQEFRLRFLIERVSRDIEPELATPEQFTPMQVEAAKSVLVIAPHMDDEVIGCGGLIAQYHNKGASVTVLYLTDGAMRNLPQEDYSQICRDRRSESERAADILGVDRCLYLSVPERNLAAAALDPEPMRRAIEQCQPDIILVPSLQEHHPDHRVACQWLKLALAGQSYAPSVIYYEVWGSCSPNKLLVLDAASWRCKVQALDMYQTQLQSLDYQKLMTYLNETRGMCAQVKSKGVKAEAYRQMQAQEFVAS